MSEPIPEAIPTSSDFRSRRPVKRAKLSNNASATSTAADEISYLMSAPDIPVAIPEAESKSKMNAPPEIVSNVQGSSAGAGSGEFHVYKASRRREYERLAAMEEEAQKEEDDEKWSKEREKQKLEDEERARRKREKRNKRKKGKGKGGKEDGTDVETPEVEVGGDQRVVKKPLQISRRLEDGEEDGEGETAVVEAAKETGLVIHDDD